jgi:CS domain
MSIYNADLLAVSHLRTQTLQSPITAYTLSLVQGVQVETPEERRAGQIVTALKDADDLQAREPFTYVLIPANSSAPLQELECPRPANYKGGDLLLEHLKLHFAQNNKEVDLALLKSQQPTLLGANLGDDQAVPTVSDEALRKVAKQVSVESFTLADPSPMNKYTGIFMYLDEGGMLKRLPLNIRASQYARLVGFDPPPQFYGDVFMGRVIAKDQMENMSLHIGPDTSMQPPWLQNAIMQNIKIQSARNVIASFTERYENNTAPGSNGREKEEQGYTWTQTEDEIEIQLVVPSKVTSKDIKVKFMPQHLTVNVHDKEKITLRLFQRVDLDGCSWTLEKGKYAKKLRLSLEKIDGAYWPRIVD